MSITDELRKWAEEFWEFAYSKFGDKAELLAIADRIDAEHDAKVAETASGWDYWESTHVKLPVDADGEAIHVGDVLTDGEYKFKVFELAAFGDGSWSIRNEDGNAWAACDVTHHHEPTVEDVLREFAEKITDSQIPDVHPTYEEAIAEYATKLRLAGDAE